VDANETAEIAALRELHEETGYKASKILRSSVICSSDPGLTNANMKVVMVEVDLGAEENKDVKPKLEDGEFIERRLVNLDGLLETLEGRYIYLVLYLCRAGFI
jgi:ADP-ribose pyrophosphatase